MPVKRRQAGGLHRVLGTAALFSTAYGNVGSSIYYALGLVTVYALGLTPVAFVISGIIFFFTAVTYAEATARFPEAGGSSSFTRHAFNEAVSFFAGWAQMLNYTVTIAISAIFVAQFFGIHLDFSQYLLIALVSVLGSAATAGTTGAVVMLTLTLSTLGLPLAGVGLLLAIDPILDMGRTAVNVAGQALVPTIVSKRQGILDESLYNAPRNGTPFVEEETGKDAAAGGSATDGTSADTAPRELQDAKA